MKKSFVLRLDDEMYKLLEKWAADEFRSVNGQLEYIINQSLVNSGRKKNKTDNKSTDKK
ncbi:MAG: Arc family DNA-binding protein [Chryseobacterium sp.]|nr:Arc family DNA-binding protein [Chryseobacterium sp.]